MDAFFVNLQTNVYVRIRLLMVVHREGLIESSMRVIPMKAFLLQVYGRRRHGEVKWLFGHVDFL